MARVFRGKVAIPGEEMGAYLEALGQFERDKAPLRAKLEQYAGDFARTLAQQYAPKTVRKHTAIIALFVEFVCWQTDVQRLEEITRGMANSAFRQWYQRKVGDRTESELKTGGTEVFPVPGPGEGRAERGRAKEFTALVLQRRASEEKMKP